MRFIRVISSEDGGGANSAHIEVVEWDNAFGSGASKVGSRTFMVAMVSAPAISARVRVQAVAAVMSRVLTVAFEAIGIGRETFFSFA